MGIKSFQGSRRVQQKVTKTTDVPFQVKDYMTTDLVTFQPNQTVEEVIDKLIKHRISGGPVVNEKNELIGIVSEGDCIKQISESRYHNLPIDMDSIEKFMVKDVETIDANMSVFDAASKFLNSKLRRFPIIEDGKLIGQISQKDILKAAIKLKGQSW